MGANTFTLKLQQVLRAHPAGISEFDLIKWLEADGQIGFDKDCLRTNLSLFQTHFLLFHSLYLLRDELSARGDARLDISALCIQLIPLTHTSPSTIDQHDPLRVYYLDLSNLENTHDNEVDALLNAFWERFIGDDERRQALSVLELQDPVDWPTIKSRHRRLVMQHHPDRGGDKARLQAINAAMNRLAHNYK
ncbi:MAG TPA: molecular chaperone DnaJ [Gammaproteobacteria bacterium]|nr:molecular chaperone DnaJ [Gammaproteobacteria bacterium]